MRLPSPAVARRLEVAVATVILLAGLADAVSTAVGLHHGAREMNVVAVMLFHRFGVVPVLLLRVLPPAFGAFLLVRWARRDRVILGAAVTALTLVALGWMVVAASNTSGVL
jgi:hypothetical protein